MTDSTTFMEFPCDFPLKIIAEHSSTMMNDITAIILNHYPETPLTNITSKPSERGNYIAITAILHVLNQPTLDELYYALGKFPGIKMVL